MVATLFVFDALFPAAGRRQFKREALTWAAMRRE
jgi:hypothetical protein